MSSLRISMAGVMALAAIGILLLMYSGMHPAPVTAVKVDPPPLLNTYLIAAHPLPAGTLAREEDFATKSVPVRDVPEGAMLDTPDARTGLRGSLIRVFLDTGHPVTANDVLRPRERGFLASVLQPGTRAISIAVDAVSGVSGLIWPGDHVDVVLTHEITSADPAHHALSETVVSDIRIIGIDQEIVQGAPTASTSAGKVVRTVTVQVAPDQVEKILVAGHLGKLALAIRAAADQPSLASPTGTFGGDVSPALAAEGRGTTVRVLEGGGATKDFKFNTRIGG